MDRPTPPLQLVRPVPDDADDDTLLLAAAGGVRDAFGRLVRRHEARVRGYCRGLLHDVALADEAAQETFLKVWESRTRYRPEGRFRSWLLTLATHTCRSLGRRARVRSFFSGLLGAGDPTTTPDASHDHAETERTVVLRAAIARLPAHFREPLLLRFVEELPYEELARVIGRTPSAARSRIHHGLRALAAELPPEFQP